MAENPDALIEAIRRWNTWTEQQLEDELGRAAIADGSELAIEELRPARWRAAFTVEDDFLPEEGPVILKAAEGGDRRQAMVRLLTVVGIAGLT